MKSPVDREAIRRAVTGLHKTCSVRARCGYFTAARREAIRRAALALQKTRPAQAAGILRKVTDAEYRSRVRKAERINDARN